MEGSANKEKGLIEDVLEIVSNLRLGGDLIFLLQKMYSFKGKGQRWVEWHGTAEKRL